MFKRLRKNKKAQNTAEYALLISLVVAAIIAMQVYAQRGLQGRIRDAVQGYLVDQTANPRGVGVTGLGVTGLAGSTAQYEPYYLSSNYGVTRTEDQSQSLLPGRGLNTVTARTESERTRARGGFQESVFCLQSNVGY